jgi:hypothetical protein
MTDAIENMVHEILTTVDLYEKDWIGLPLATLEAEIKKAFCNELNADIDWSDVADEIYQACAEEENERTHADFFANDGMGRGYGSLYDTGKADSYYGRQQNPHYYVNQNGVVSCIADLTEEQIAEYVAGYDDNNAAGDFKDWG